MNDSPLRIWIIMLVAFATGVCAGVGTGIEATGGWALMPWLLLGFGLMTINLWLEAREQRRGLKRLEEICGDVLTDDAIAPEFFLTIGPRMRHDDVIRMRAWVLSPPGTPVPQTYRAAMKLIRALERKN